VPQGLCFEFHCFWQSHLIKLLTCHVPKLKHGGFMHLQQDSKPAKSFSLQGSFPMAAT